MKHKDLRLQFHPVTKKRWTDFETLFGERGACGGCWCMLWRLRRKEFESQKKWGQIFEIDKIPFVKINLD
jgi:hypothetical protein